jgi:restriction system protein
MAKRRRRRKGGSGPRHKYNSEYRRRAEGRVRIRLLTEQRQTNELLMQAIVVPGDSTHEGTLIKAVAVPWFELIKQMNCDPNFMYQIDWRKWEEMIAGAYERSGFDEVILTPRSGDLGRDVIAIKLGVGSIRVVDQMKKYKPGHLVTANEVRAMLGVVCADPKTSKGVITTTSDFAPGIAQDTLIQPFVPFRLELKSGAELLDWLKTLASATD